MRIGSKLALIVTILVLGVSIALTVMISFTNIIISLKDFENKSQQVLSNLEQITLRTGSLLTSNSRITQQREQLQSRVEQFEKALLNFASQESTKYLGEQQRNALHEAVGWWEQITTWYFIPAFNHLDVMIEKGTDTIVQDAGLFQTYLRLSQAGTASPFIANYQTLKNYQLLILENTETFKNRMEVLIEQTRLQTEEAITGSRQIAISIVAISLISTILLVTRFTALIVRRIKQIGKAMEVISRGDFSNQLSIRSGDEFEELSENYNTLKNQLKEKLDSVLDFMFRIGGLQASDPDPEKVLHIVIESAIENTEADAGALFLVNEKSQQIKAAEIIGLFPPPFAFPESLSRKKEAVDQYLHNHPLRLGETVIGKSIAEKQPLFLRDAREEFGDIPVDDPLYLSSLIIVPLSLPERLLGAVAIAKSGSEAFFSDLDFTHMRTFADYAALTIDSMYNYAEMIERRELSREIEIAAGIQKDLLPGRLPEIEGAAISASTSAAKGVSGDYYDVFHLGNGIYSVVICDVVGKGIPAAMLMVMIRTILRLSSTADRKPAKILSFINKGITGKIGVDHFATMALFHFDSNRSTISFSNAAHLPLLIYRQKGKEFIELDTPGLPIGIEADETYSQRQFQTEKGDILLLYTDGLTESRNLQGEEFGLSRLKALIAEDATLSDGKLVQKINRSISDFAGEAEQHDDQTFIVLKMA